MIVQCDQCQTRFRVPDDRVPAEGTHVRCSKCHCTFWFSPPAAASPPLSKASAGVEVSLPDRPDFAPAPPSNDKDSWFELPKLGPDDDNLADGMGPSTPQPTEKHDLQFRDSWWGTNSLDMLLQEQGLSLDSLAQKSGGDSPRPTVKAAAPTPSPILGNALEDLATTSHFDPSYPELVSKRPQDVKLEVPHNALAQTNTAPATSSILGNSLAPEPAAPPLFDGAALASVKQPADFLLLDHAQQRQDFWYTAAPLAVRGLLLLLLLFSFVALWTILDNQNSNASGGFSSSGIKQTFLGSTSSWRLSKIKIQQVPLRKHYLLLVTGRLQNNDSSAKVAPDIQINTLPQHTAQLPCCQSLSTKEIATIRSRGALHRHYAALAARRPQIKANESKTFTLLLMPQSPRHTIELNVQPPRPYQWKQRPTPRKAPLRPAQLQRNPAPARRPSKRRHKARRRPSKRRHKARRRPGKRRNKNKRSKRKAPGQR